jgi:glycosyltransferase involved in cell wall biosynthesis
MMMNLEGGVRPAVYLAYALVERGHEVYLVSPVMAGEVEDHLIRVGVTPVNLRVNLFSKYFSAPFMWLELWGREALFRLSSRLVGYHRININFSHTFSVPSEFWYVQGPTFASLEDCEEEFSGIYRVGYKFLKPIIDLFDKEFVKDIGRNSKFIIANSKYCANLYRKLGINVNDVIYPPIDCGIFKPQTSKPSLDYVLTYFGKETKFSVVKSVADLGVKIKVFGSKMPFMSKYLMGHSNVDFLGRVSTDELVYLYSNALFTLFPFTHEPFGYIPIESMACGTPVLTYNRQGPGETVVDGYSGWLVESDRELISKALKLWRNGYDLKLRRNCVKIASKFDLEQYVEKWLEALDFRITSDLALEE